MFVLSLTAPAASGAGSVYGASGIAIRAGLGHASLIAAWHFPQVWAVEEWGRILMGKRLER